MSAATSHAPSRRRPLPSSDQVTVRLLVLGGAMVALLAAQVGGARPAGWVQVAVLLMAVVLSLRPESLVGVPLLGALALVWASGPTPLSPLVLLASAGLVTSHVAAVLAAHGPAVGRIDRRQARRWSLRALALWASSALAWVLSVVVEDHPGGRSTYGVGLLLLVAVAVLGSREVGRRGRVGR